jgi:hypothetical protein
LMQVKYCTTGKTRSRSCRREHRGWPGQHRIAEWGRSVQAECE